MSKYPLPMILIHWLTVLAVAIAYITSGDPTEATSTTEQLIGETHVFTGDLVFVLVLLRIILKRLLPQPPVINTNHLLELTAQTVHGVLYGLMLVTPIAGWCALTSKVEHFHALIFDVPLLAKPDEFIELIGEYHPLIGNVFITLAGLHAAAGLLHHYYLKDGTLRKMLPF